MIGQLIIDRFEGEYAVCEGEDREYCIGIKRTELPDGAKEGSVLSISPEGKIFLDQEETQRRRKRILAKHRRAFGGNKF